LTVHATGVVGFASQNITNFDQEDIQLIRWLVRTAI